MGKKTQRRNKKQEIIGGTHPTLALKGGAGAPDYAIALYGDGDAQKAAPGGGNVIDMNKSAITTGGGKKKKMDSKDGGSAFVDLAVPAVLVYSALASKKCTKRRKMGGRKNRSIKKRR